MFKLKIYKEIIKSLIKISDKHSNFRLKFEHPIALNPEKKYKLGVRHLLFSFQKGYKINLFFDYLIPVPDTNIVVTAKGDVYGNYTIASLKKKSFNGNSVTDSTC